VDRGTVEIDHMNGLLRRNKERGRVGHLASAPQGSDDGCRPQG